MKRRLFNILSALSVMLLLSVLVLWRVDYGNTPPDLTTWRIFTVFGWSVGVGAGGFSVHHYRKLSQPQSVDNGTGGIDPGLSVRVVGQSWEKWGVRYRASPHWNWGQRNPPLVGGVLDLWTVSYRSAATVTATLPALWLGTMCWRCLRGRRPVPGTCTQCGYDLRASNERCPECGTAIPAQTASSGGKT